MGAASGRLRLALVVATMCAFFLVCVDLQHLLATSIGYTPPSVPSWLGARRSDGFGAQYHSKMCAFAVCQRLPGLYYRHVPFTITVRGHNASVGGHVVTSSTATDLDVFTGMRDDEAPTSVWSERLDSFDVHPTDADPSSYYSAEVRSALRTMYFSRPKPTPIECDVALHIRRGDASLPWHNLSKRRFTDNKSIQRALTPVLRGAPNCRVALFSEGKTEDFGSLASIHNIEFHLNEDLLVTFHSLVCAPTLVIANSSLSYAAALLCEGRVCYITPFWHNPLEHWEYIGAKE
jgi:hypothetical protein